MVRATLFLFLIFVLSSRADSWLPARQFESFSENERFVVTITPATDGTKANATVSEVIGKQRKELWRSPLSNPVAPTQAFVSNGGEVIVTLNNWGGIGYGDDVVAIYAPEGQRAKYSLEQIAPLPVKKGEVGFLSGYQKKFSHSTSSRHWSQDSLKFFASEGADSFFCIWLLWDDRWAAWRLGDGILIEPTKTQTKNWNLRGAKLHYVS